MKKKFIAFMFFKKGEKRMKKNIKKWVKALESGEYTQTSGRLEVKKEDGSFAHCVMGVACRLYANEHPDWEVRVVSDYSYFEFSSFTPPLVVLEWLGLEPPLVCTSNGTSLIGLNDSGVSFSDLAKIIKTEYL